MLKTIAAIAVTAAISIGAPAIATTHPGPPIEHTKKPRWLTTECKWEDSVNCYWNAHTEGDGRGHSYYVIMIPGKAHMVCQLFWDSAYAKRHDYCTGNGYTTYTPHEG